MGMVSARRDARFCFWADAWGAVTLVFYLQGGPSVWMGSFFGDFCGAKFKGQLP